MQGSRLLRLAGRKALPAKYFISIIRSYLFSFDNVLALGLFTAAVAGLITHKIIIIELHQPLPKIKILFASPFLFIFDAVTLTALHYGLNALLLGIKVLAGVIAVIIISCSAAFTSLYFEGNAELNWGRSVEVSTLFSSWS